MASNFKVGDLVKIRNSVIGHTYSGTREVVFIREKSKYSIYRSYYDDGSIRAIRKHLKNPYKERTWFREEELRLDLIEMMKRKKQGLTNGSDLD